MNRNKINQNIGLYFGSFNPIHLGHLIIAQFIVTHYPLDEIWFVVSPQNPFKQNQELADASHRAAMVKLAIKGNDNLLLSTVEFDLPKPSYTIKTLDFLRSKYPHTKFSIILGEDNIMNLHRWKSYEKILANFPIFVYPRLYKKEQYSKLTQKDFPQEIQSGNFTIVDAPIIALSSTAIRKNILKNLSVRYQVVDSVLEYIQKHRLYRV